MKRLLLLLPIILYGAEMSSSSLSSKKASYDGNALILKGDVQVDHALGKLASGLARLEKEEKEGPFSSISLRDDVLITLKDLGNISCAKADLDFVTMTGKLLPKAGQLIRFVDLGPDYFSIASEQADLEFEKEGSSYRVSKLDADGQVQVEYGADFILDADHATYVNDGSPHISATPNCKISHHDDLIEAERAELYPHLEMAMLFSPKGILNPRGIHFCCQKMSWEHQPQLLTLQGNIVVDDGKLGTLRCHEEIQIHQKQQEGKWTLSSMVAKGKTELTTCFKQLLICYGQMELDEQQHLLTLQSPSNQQIEYFYDQMKLCSDHAQLEYTAEYDPKKLQLSGDVKLQIEETGSRCATADHCVYLPGEEKMILTAEDGKNVLFWDKEQDLSVSAREVHVMRVEEKEIIKGVGNVRFAFTAGENELLKKLFPFYSGEGS